MKLIEITLCVAMPAMLSSNFCVAQDHGTMLWLSDMHFDPFFGGEVLRLANDSQTGWQDHTKWPDLLNSMTANDMCAPAGSDANSHLVQKVLNGAQTTLSNKPDFILITGDFLSHNFSNAYFSGNGLPNSLTTVELHNQFIDETMAYLAMSVSNAFPGVPVIAALGNNDAYCGDYDIRGDSGFLAHTRKIFQRYFLPDLSSDFQSMGGCYTTAVPGTKHRFLVVNSVPFISDYPESYRITGISSLNTVCSPLRNIELSEEFDWMKQQMSECEPGQKVWLACHIPPGVACYDGTQNWPRTVSTAQGQVPFVNEFREYYLEQRDHFAGILTGHSHAAEFKLIRDDNGDGRPAASVLMAPSIGRNHGNNSSFRVLKFDRATLAISDYETHWLDGSQSPPAWATPFRFTTTYAQPDVSPQSLLNVYEAMKAGRKAPSGMTYLDQYFFDYSTRNGSRNSKSRTHYQKALGSILGP